MAKSKSAKTKDVLSPEGKKMKRIFKKALNENIAAHRSAVQIPGVTFLNDAKPAIPMQEIPHDPEIANSGNVISRTSRVRVDLPQIFSEVEAGIYEFAAVLADARVTAKREGKGSAYMTNKIQASIRGVNMITERLVMLLHHEQAELKKAKKN